MKPLTDKQVSAIIARILHGDAAGLLALTYGRVSTTKQVQGVSLKGQKGRMQRYADERRVGILRHYEEPGESAWRGRRPVFQELLADLPHWRDQGVCLLIVYQLDRFARNLHYALDVLQILRAHGIIVVSVVDMVDYTTAEGWKAFMNRLTEAEAYSRRLSEIMVDTRLSEAEEGRIVGPVPTGYRRAEGGAEPDERAEQQRWLFERAATGEYSYTALVDLMNSRDYRAWSEQAGQAVTYTKYNLIEMLHNPFYIGQVRVNGKTYPGNHPGIIAQDTWDRVQAVFARRKSRRAPTTRTDRLLTGLLGCVHCGAIMWQHHITTTGATYRCPNRERGTCAARDVPEGIVLPTLHTILGMLTVPLDWHAVVARKAAALLDPAPEAAPIDRARELQRLRLEFLDRTISEAEYLRRRAALEQPAATKQQQIGIDLEAAAAYLADLPALFAKGDLPRRRALLHSLFETFFVDKGAGVVAYTPREPYRDLMASAGYAALMQWGAGEPGGGRVYELPTGRIPSVWQGYLIPLGTVVAPGVYATRAGASAGNRPAV